MFNDEKSKLLREAGMKIAAENKPHQLKYARHLAVQMLLNKQIITADDVGRCLKHLGFKSNFLGPAAGSLFKHACFERVGTMKKSVRISNHSRLLWEYRLASGWREHCDFGGEFFANLPKSAARTIPKDCPKPKQESLFPDERYQPPARS